MMRRAVGRWRHGLAAVGLVLLLVPAGAMASQRPKSGAKPRVSLSLPGQVSEGAAIPFSWSSRNLGKRYKLVIQRPVGTARTWRTMIKLSARRGSGELPGQALGRRRFRLAAFRGKRLLARQVVRIGVFGPVPFSVLYRGRIDGGVYATPTSSFPYIDKAEDPGEFDQPTAVFSVEHNHCSAVHIDFVPGEGFLWSREYDLPSAGIFTVVQQSRDPVSASASFDEVGAVDAELVPGQTWSLLAAYRDGSRPYIYFNGYAICSTTEPFFS